MSRDYNNDVGGSYMSEYSQQQSPQVIVVQQERPRRSKWGKFALAGAVAATALVVYNKYECFINEWEGASLGTVTGMLGCLVDDGADAHTEIGGIGLKTEDIIDKSVIVTFGTVAMQMEGTGRFAYNGSWYKDLPGWDDVVWYYNEGNDQTTEVRAVVGTRFSTNYENGINLEGPAKETDQSTVKVDVDYSADGTTIDQITIDAGMVDLFWPHIPTTMANESLLHQRGWAAGSFGAEEWAANNYAMKTLLLDAALAQSCGPELFDGDKVDEVIKTFVRGDLTSDPARAAMVSQAFADGKVVVNKQSSDERRAAYQAKYEADKAAFTDGSAFEPGLEIDMEISGIEVRACDAEGVSVAVPQ